MDDLLPDLALLTIRAYGLVVGTVLLTVPLYVDRSYVDGSSCVVFIIDTTHSITASRAVRQPSHGCWRTKRLVSRGHQCRRTLSALTYIKRCSGVLYPYRERKHGFGASSCVSSSVMGLAPSSERQGGRTLWNRMRRVSARRWECSMEPSDLEKDAWAL
jgi:hypothetical protein